MTGSGAPGDRVGKLRRRLGPTGVAVGVDPAHPADARVVRAAAGRLAAAGWRAVWSNEGVGSDVLVRSALWLGASSDIVVGSCVANVWARPAPTAAAAVSQLAQAFPGRFVLGLGVGRPEQASRVGREFASPAATARAYLTELGERSYPVLLAANGPRLAEVAAELADGVLPAGRPPAETASMRATLGPDQLVVVYLPIAAGDPADEIARRVARHREAGADHVVVGRSYDTDFAEALEGALALADTLATLS